MPRRKIVFATGETYHVFNRSIAKEALFSSKINLRKALEIVDFYRRPQKLRLSKFKSLRPEIKNAHLKALTEVTPLVEIYAFAFMPNHYHFLLRQLQENGISKFIGNFQNSFAKVFNLKNDRNGALFQNQFRARRPETDEEFLHLSRYIHLNPVTSYLIEFGELAAYPWTSFSIYAGHKKMPFLNVNAVMDMIGSSQSYAEFIADQVDYQRTLGLLKHLVIE